jgi:hypothetical protein
MLLVLLTIFLPKKQFSDYSLKKIIDFMIKNNLSYQLIGEDNICVSLSGNIYTCHSVKEAIKKNLKSNVLFIPGGIGTLNLLNNTLSLSYLNSFDLLKDIVFLERESILVFYKLGKLYGRYIAKPINVENKLEGCIEVEEEVFVDNNLITSSKLYSVKFIEIFKKTLLELFYL